ncbi:unnamed protein product, partial [Brassica oleracea]
VSDFDEEEDIGNNEDYLQTEDVDALEANNQNQKKYELCIGMDFSSDVSAYKAYRKYGGNHGGSSFEYEPLDKIVHKYTTQKPLQVHLKKKKKVYRRKEKKYKLWNNICLLLLLSCFHCGSSKICKTLHNFQNLMETKAVIEEGLLDVGILPWNIRSSVSVPARNHKKLSATIREETRTRPPFITSEYSVNIPFLGKFNINLFRVVWRTAYVVGVLSLTNPFDTNPISGRTWLDLDWRRNKNSI